MQLPAHTDIPDSLGQSGVFAFNIIRGDLGRVRGLIDEQFDGCNDSIGRLLKDFRSRSGKMIRPALVLLAGASCGKVTEEHIRVAAIIEIIHNATLLHDDVIDEADKRRALPTINDLWGNESAVLLGDFLLSKASKMCAQLESRINKVIADATVQVCEGELRQVIQRRNWQLSESEYIDIITEKSASFFRCACFIGGLLADASKGQLRALAEFGCNTGIAFQITDDLLDIIGDESKTGKTLGSDVDKSKLTLAVIHLLGRVGEAEKTAVIDSLAAGGNLPGERDAESAVRTKEGLVKMLSSYGSLEYAKKRAEQFVAKAIAALAELQQSDAKDALIETARFVAARTV